MGLENFILNILIFIGIYMILGLSLQIALGYTGLLNFGHAAFYGIGAYASALLAINLNFPFWISFLIAGLIASIFGLLLSFPTLKLRGDYLALATIGFGIIIEQILKNWKSLTRGPLGIPGIPKPIFFTFEFSSLLSYLILVYIIVILVYLILSRIVNSPFGRVLKSIRDDELAASTLGKNIFKYKTLALMISAFFAGIAGSLYAHYVTYIDPTSFNILQSVLIVSIIVIGGLASLKGAIIGAIILILLPEPLRFLNIPNFIVGGIRQILYSILLIIILLKRPKGIIGEDVAS